MTREESQLVFVILPSLAEDGVADVFASVSRTFVNALTEAAEVVVVVASTGRSAIWVFEDEVERLRDISAKENLEWC